MYPPLNAFSEKTTITNQKKKISKCCHSTVSMLTNDDFHKINVNEKDTWIMTVAFICNKCGKKCEIMEVDE